MHPHLSYHRRDLSLRNSHVQRRLVEIQQASASVAMDGMDSVLRVHSWFQYACIGTRIDLLRSRMDGHAAEVIMLALILMFVIAYLAGIVVLFWRDK